jgi:hypothetical protein
VGSSVRYKERGKGTNEVEHDFQAMRVSGVDKLLAVFKASKRLMNVLVVRDVVSLVHARTLVVRRDPESFNSEGNEVRKLVDNAAKVTQAVAVVVFEGGRVDLKRRES